MKAAVVALFLVISLLPSSAAAGQKAVRDFSGTPAPDAGTPVRLRFAAGTIATTRAGHLAPLASDLFVLAAQRGQVLETFVESPGALLAVWGPDGAELVPGAGQMAAWRVILPAQGDYFIAVNSTGRATDYRLTVIIDTQAATGATRIQFAAGATSAAKSGRIAAGVPARYVLRALADQTLAVSPSAPQPGLLYSVVGADGAVLKPFSAGAGPWQSILHATQDYIIVLLSPDVALTYALTVSAGALRPTPPPPPPSRIQFQSGATSAALSGQLAPGRMAAYVLRASAGQVMQVSLWANTRANILIWGADGSRLNRGLEEEQGWQGTVHKTQDYTIELIGQGVAASYCLRVTVFARIQFGRGATSAMISSPVQTCVPQGVEVVGGYALRASAGQTMRVTMKSAARNVYLTIVGADGTAVKYYDDWRTVWEGVLPATQDYHLLPVAVGGDSRFTLTVTVVTLSQTPPIRLQFAAGTTSATFAGHLAQGAPVRYVLRAARGQRLEVRVRPAPTEYSPPRLSVAVTGPDGSAWSGLALDDAIDPLPASGDYVITLALQPGSPAANYTMQVAIPAP